MNILFDSSVFLRQLDKNYPSTAMETASKEILNFIDKVVKLVILNPSYEILIPTIVFAELATNGFYYFQKIAVQEYLETIRHLIIFDKNREQELLDKIIQISMENPTKGGADNLIIAYADNNNCVILTGDKQQYNKAKKVHLESYYFYEKYDRERFLNKMI